MRIAGYVVALTIPILAVTGCSKSAMSVDEIEKTVTNELNKSYTDIGRKVDSVRCPDQMAEAENDKAYICTAEIEKNQVRVSVVMKDGQVAEIAALDAVYDLAKLSKELTDQNTKAVGHPVSVNCGTGIRVLPAGDKITCEYVDGDKKGTLDFTATILKTPPTTTK